MLSLLLVVALGVCLPISAAAQDVVRVHTARDAIGSVRIVFDASGNIVGRMDYGPFGEQLSASTMGHKSYAGLFQDGEAGLDYAEARMYQPRTARFSAPDPVYAALFRPQAWNRYSYALNSPASLTDATGLQVEGPRNAPPNTGGCSAEFSFEKCGGDDLFWNSGSGGFGFDFGNDFAGAQDRGYVSGMPWDIWEGLQEFLSRAGQAFDQWREKHRLAKPTTSSELNGFRLTDENGNEIQVNIAGVPSGPGAAVAAAAVGRYGEQLVRAAFAIGPKVQTLINGRFRFPDGTTIDKISEIKNVAHQPWTLQLRDYAQHAAANGKTFDSWIRSTTRISGPLAEAARTGQVRIIPVLPPR